MKEKELRENCTCVICNNKIGHTGIPMFWRITVERYILNLAVIKRQAGLEMQLGGHVALAQIMGPDEEMTKPVMEPVTATICEDCGINSQLPIAAIAGMLGG